MLEHADPLPQTLFLDFSNSSATPGSRSTLGRSELIAGREPLDQSALDGYTG